MNRPKPISKAEINERALWIAADMLVVAGYSTVDAEPGEPHKMRRWIRNKARQELLNERKLQKKPIRSPAERVRIGEEEGGSGREAFAMSGGSVMQRASSDERSRE